jgi:type VI secretion system protein ImpH
MSAPQGGERVAQERQPAPALEAALGAALARLPELGFYALLSLFERLTPSEPRIGDANSPREERLRLCHDASLAFSPGDIAAVRLAPNPEAPGAILQVVTTFLGVTGAVAPLPDYMAEEATGEDAEAERVRDFLDLFHHRWLSLLYRGVAKYRPSDEATARADDAWSGRALALVGPGATRAQAVPPALLLRLAPLLVDGARPARSLELALEVALSWALGPKAPTEAPTARVEQFARAWVEMEELDRMALGARNCALGIHAPLGRHMFARGGILRIHLAGLSSRSHARLASGELRQLLAAVVELFSRDPVDFELVLDLPPEQRPLLKLGRPSSGRLGVDSWLTCAPAAEAAAPAAPFPTAFPTEISKEVFSCASIPGSSSAG